MTALAVTNRAARRLWLHGHGLLAPPTGPLDVMKIVRALGFVQIDTIRNVTRAHNHIIWSRNVNFREGGLWPYLASRELFEHFTHDASLIPSGLLPFWRRQFDRLGAHVARHEWYQSGLARQQIADIKARIMAEGALSTRAFDTKITGERGMWARPPHKKALDQMWYAGELATSHRVNFEKFYDLSARVFTPHDPLPDHVAVDGLCNRALDRLGFASPGEVQRFWGATSARETRGWAAGANHVPVLIEAADGNRYPALAVPGIEVRIAALPAPGQRMRLINPFDPAIRDRARLQRLFGFEYRNEMFVPRAKRRWGYYVYPLLEGDRFTGRIELAANRRAGSLAVTGFWPEPGNRWSAPRAERLEAELARFARFGGLKRTDWQVPSPSGKL